MIRQHHTSRRISNKSSVPDMEDDLSLHEATWFGDITKIRDILKNSDSKSHINDPDMEWGLRTPLHIAADRGHVTCCRALLEQGASPHSRMNQGWTPAHCAAENGHIEVLKILAEYSADLSTCDDYGDKPQRIAQIYGHTMCVRYLNSLVKCPKSLPSTMLSTAKSARPKLRRSKRESSVNCEVR